MAAAAAGSPFGVVSGTAVIPHPAKADKGGEDACFATVRDDGAAIIGVADDVGGWAELGVDPARFSRLLMFAAEEAMQGRAGLTPADLVKGLHDAWTRAREETGSSTACVCAIAPGEAAETFPPARTLTCANLGDSGFLLIRNGAVVAKSEPQQHNFNFPFQLGSDPGSDKPDAADEYEESMQAGDVLVVGTDGLFDNVYDEEIVSIVTETEKEKPSATQVAEAIAAFASLKASSQSSQTPFADAAHRCGLRFEGGKLDDITCVCVLTTPAASP